MAPKHFMNQWLCWLSWWLAFFLDIVNFEIIYDFIAFVIIIPIATDSVQNTAGIFHIHSF